MNDCEFKAREEQDRETASVGPCDACGFAAFPSFLSPENGEGTGGGRGTDSNQSGLWVSGRFVMTPSPIHQQFSLTEQRTPRQGAVGWGQEFAR